MNRSLFAWPPRNTPDAPVSPAASSLPTGDGAGATVSATVAPVAPAAVESAPAPAAPAVVEAPAVVATEVAPAVSHDFKPSLLEATDPADPAAPATEVKPPETKPGETPPEVKAEDAKPPETPAEPEVLAPIAYEFRFPENVDANAIDKPVLEKYTEILNKARVPAEVAQEALDLHLTQIQETAKRLSEVQWDVFNRQQETWQTQVKSDPELGGAKFKTMQRNAARFIEGMGLSPTQIKSVMDAMRTTGAGNHPDIYRLFARAGERFFKEGEARNMPPARQVAPTREQKQKARYT